MKRLPKLEKLQKGVEYGKWCQSLLSSIDTLEKYEANRPTMGDKWVDSCKKPIYSNIARILENPVKP